MHKTICIESIYRNIPKKYETAINIQSKKEEGNYAKKAGNFGASIFLSKFLHHYTNFNFQAI